MCGVNDDPPRSGLATLICSFVLDDARNAGHEVRFACFDSAQNVSAFLQGLPLVIKPLILRCFQAADIVGICDQGFPVRRDKSQDHKKPRFTLDCVWCVVLQDPRGVSLTTSALTSRNGHAGGAVWFERRVGFEPTGWRCQPIAVAHG